VIRHGLVSYLERPRAVYGVSAGNLVELATSYKQYLAVARRANHAQALPIIFNGSRSERSAAKRSPSTHLERERERERAREREISIDRRSFLVAKIAKR